jgi:hypothetical protein
MGSGGGDDDKKFTAKEFVFVIQMAWTPKSLLERQEAKKTRLEEEAKAKAEAAAAEPAEAGTDAANQ